MSLGESIRHGAKWLLAGNLAGQILQFAFGIVLARVLVPADFGLLVTVQIFTGLAGFIATGGTGQALVRAKEAKLEDFQVVFTIQLAIGLLIYALFFITAPLFAHWYKEPLYNELFRVSALSFILRPFVNMPSIWLTREMRFKQRTVVSLACGTLGSIVSVLLALQDFGVWSLVLGGLSGAALSAAALYGITPVRPAIRFDPALARELGLYGFKFTSNEIATYVRKPSRCVTGPGYRGTIQQGGQSGKSAPSRNAFGLRSHFSRARRESRQSRQISVHLFPNRHAIDRVHDAALRGLGLAGTTVCRFCVRPKMDFVGGAPRHTQSNGSLSLNW